jgi:hypothetical protein
MPGRHPDDDVLADLAADVLPAEQARAVEAHVLGCDRCAGLLEDAERVRGLLLAGDPGPVPDDVWRRIESALAAETMPGGSTRSTDRAADTAAFQAFVDAPTAPGRVVPLPAPPPDHVDDADPGWGDDADPLDDPDRWTGDRSQRSTRGGGTASRREARDPGPRRRGPLLLAAAAAVAVVAVVGSIRLAGRDSSSEASLTAGGAAAASSSSASGSGTRGSATAGSVPIVESGRSYRQRTLAADAESLLGVGAKDGGLATASPPPRSSAAASPQAPVPGPAGSGGTRSESLVQADPKADDITNPARLAACLGALGVPQERLVAVDLATYDGREAAILLVTPAEGGGHEVWAVERTCGPGAEGALGYTRLRD